MENEHWKKNEKGKFEGLYFVDPNKSKSGRWGRIEETIREYTLIHPQEMTTHLAEVSNQRKIVESVRNVTATSKNKTMQWGVSVPHGLYIVLEKAEPELFNNKKLYREFARRFSGLRIAKEL